MSENDRYALAAMGATLFVFWWNWIAAEMRRMNEENEE